MLKYALESQASLRPVSTVIARQMTSPAINDTAYGAHHGCHQYLRQSNCIIVSEHRQQS